MNGAHFAFAVTFFGGVFVIICVYFDRQRHKDPYFRKRLKLKRDQLKCLPEPELLFLDDNEKPQDQEILILKEIERAELLMGQQKYNTAIIHFANAIAVCVDPCNLLIALKQSLPPQAFDLLIHVLLNRYGAQLSRFQNDERMNKILDH